MSTERPICQCHGEPMARNGHDRGRQRWMCAEARRSRSREDYYERGHRERKRCLYYERKAEGLCTSCGAPSLTTALCWSCLSRLEEHYALRL